MAFSCDGPISQNDTHGSVALNGGPGFGWPSLNLGLFCNFGVPVPALPFRGCRKDQGELSGVHSTARFLATPGSG